MLCIPGCISLFSIDIGVIKRPHVHLVDMAKMMCGFCNNGPPSPGNGDWVKSLNAKQYRVLLC